MIDGASDITFSGITLRDSAWEICSGEHFVSVINPSHPLYTNIDYTATFPQACFDAPACFTVQNASDIKLVNCEFINIGQTALMFGEKTANCSVKSSLFSGIGGNCVFIKGINDVNNTSVQTKNIAVEDCHIRNYGEVFNFAVGVLLAHASSCSISNNEIHDGLYTGISVGWNWGYTPHVTNDIAVKDNLIYNIGQGWLSDMGGIYTLGLQPDTVVSGNVIHDVGCYEDGYGGWGVYLDEGSTGITVENNLAYRCSSQGFHQHYGQDNMIRNNIFALNGEGQLRVSRKEEHNSLFLYGNILLGNDTPMYADVVEGKLTDKGNLYWDYERGEAVLSGNSTSFEDRIYRTAMERKGYYNDAVFADPLFRDAENGDFTLAKNSPALDIGFEPWDYTKAGTITLFD